MSDFVAHYSYVAVGGGGVQSAMLTTIVTASTAKGKKVRTLCGKEWVPPFDSTMTKICDECDSIRIYNNIMGF